MRKINRPRTRRSRFTAVSKLLLAILALTLLAPAVFGQGLGTIVGTITDPTGAAIPAAHVTATEVLTNLTRVFTTNVQGYYYYWVIK
jgi:hypothetical protein